LLEQGSFNFSKDFEFGIIAPAQPRDAKRQNQLSTYCSYLLIVSCVYVTGSCCRHGLCIQT
jgi:hypothetical protein